MPRKSTIPPSLYHVYVRAKATSLGLEEWRQRHHGSGGPPGGVPLIMGSSRAWNSLRTYGRN